MFDKANESELYKSYKEASKDIKFCNLVKNLGIPDEVAISYTSRLESSVKELENCKKCKGLIFCQNKLEGHVDLPKLRGKRLVFSYVPCKYLNKERMIREERENITLKDIALDDKKRIPIIKWIKGFLDRLEKGEESKGLYLYGNFGCGKTFILSALFNELENRRLDSAIVYFPELLRDLKSDFDNYGGKMEYLKNVDCLLFDDIGAESVSAWGRDEILGTILQARMNMKKKTFFTSNMSIKQLEGHLAMTKNEVDNLKARRIIERIKCLCDEMEILGEDPKKLIFDKLVSFVYNSWVF